MLSEACSADQASCYVLHVEFNVARPGLRNLHNLSSGVGPLSFFKDNTATIYVIANTGAMLDIGQERSKEETALTAEPHCEADLIYRRTPHATEFL
jgi:hypothetical protein